MHRLYRTSQMQIPSVMDHSWSNQIHWELMRGKCGCLQNTKSTTPTVSNVTLWHSSQLEKFLLRFSFFHVDEIFDTAFDVSVQISGYENRNKKFHTLNDYPVKNRTRHLKCNGNTCEDFTILHIAWLDFSRYQFTIEFYGLNQKRYDIKELKFYVSVKKIRWD